MLSFYHHRFSRSGRRFSLILWLVMGLPLLLPGCGSAADGPDTDAAGGTTSSSAGGVTAVNIGTEPAQAPRLKEGPMELPAKPTVCPKLEFVLYQLSIAPDPDSFAQQHGIAYKDGQVRVVLDLKHPDGALPQDFQLEVERQLGRQVRVMASLASLCALSDQEVVDFVHLPHGSGSLGPS